MSTTMSTTPAVDKPLIEAATQKLLKSVPSRKGLRRPIVAISGVVLLAAIMDSSSQGRVRREADVAHKTSSAC